MTLGWQKSKMLPSRGGKVVTRNQFLLSDEEHLDLFTPNESHVDLPRRLDSFSLLWIEGFKLPDQGHSGHRNFWGIIVMTEKHSGKAQILLLKTKRGRNIVVN
jgi:hypothetical protein